MLKIKTLIKKSLGEKNLGRLDYILRRDLSSQLGGAFNGQEYRKKMFDEIMSKISFKAIVETGTFRGDTTLFLAQRGLPVYTVEADSRNYGYASLRLLSKRNIFIHNGDSREFLLNLSKNTEMVKADTFFYLDAHWEDDLPLRDELGIIFKHWDKAVVMVDDFEVPGTNYGFDDYGEGKVLNMEYLSTLSDLNLSVFFPVVNVEKETGKKRGCVILCANEELINQLKTIRAVFYEECVQL